jgi:hypothetical protein
LGEEEIGGVMSDEALERINARFAHYRDHQELYFSDPELQEKTAELAKKFSIEKPKEIDTTPVMMNCPHCSQELPVGPNIRFWTPEELRSYANVLESNQAIAAANREASLAAQGAM